MNIIYTCIIGEYEKLKEPAIITPGWKYICFTDQQFVSDVWEIRKVFRQRDRANNNRYVARFYKIVASIGATRSIWVDGSFKINCDLNKWWADNFKSPMTCIKHPIRDCVYEEAEMVVKNNRGGADHILEFIKRCRRARVPVHNGLIQSGIIMREHTKGVQRFCADWWANTQLCLRDQVTFALTVFNDTLPIHYINYDYRTGRHFIFHSHYKKANAV